ncbi:MAG: hypothetical protein S4CHLAM20_12620 [Chlamydiia bacterium]|nr:hypothetical protein [Chlamydiia bacterium]
MNIIHQNAQNFLDMSIALQLNDEQVRELTQLFSDQTVEYDDRLIRHIDGRTVKNLWDKTYEYAGHDRYIGVILRVLYTLASLVSAGIFTLIDHGVQAIRREIIYNGRDFSYNQGSYTPNQAPDFDTTRRRLIQRTLEYLDSQGFLNRINGRYPNQMPDLDEWMQARSEARSQQQAVDQQIGARMEDLSRAMEDIANPVTSEARSALQESLNAAREATNHLSEEQRQGVINDSFTAAENMLRRETLEEQKAKLAEVHSALNRTTQASKGRVPTMSFAQLDSYISHLRESIQKQRVNIG